MVGAPVRCTICSHTQRARRQTFRPRCRTSGPRPPEELVAARRRFVADVLAKEPESPCGDRFAYSNVGYTIAGHIAETVAGKPYEALLQERVFVPLMLTSSGFRPPQGDAPNQEPIGHIVLLRWFRLRMDPFQDARRQLAGDGPCGRGAHDDL